MVQWFRTVLSMQKAQIQYLVWELRSPDAAQHSKKKKKKQLFSLSLVFRSLIMMCLSVDFFRSIQFGVPKFIQSRFLSHQFWEVFSHYVFEYLCKLFSFLFFWDSNGGNVRSFVVEP